MKRYILPLTFIILFSCNSKDDDPPNIVLIIGDDHGCPYYGFMGNEISSMHPEKVVAIKKRINIWNANIIKEDISPNE